MDAVQRDEAVRDAAVNLVMELRSEYLRAGASALDHWDHLQSRLIFALRSSETIEQAVTAYRMRLQLGAPSSGSSSAAVALVDAADVDARHALDLIESEVGLVMARARLEAERRKAAREQGGQ